MDPVVITTQSKQCTLSAAPHADGALLGQSPTQFYAYGVSLWRVPLVLTCNNWQTEHLAPLDKDWVRQNCVVRSVTAPVWVD